MRNMPCLKRKEVFNDFNSDPNDLEPDEYIFYIPFTKEKFRNYNEFYKKMAFYQSKHWQCKVTGKTGLTYLEALNSEKSAEQKLLLLPEVYFKPLLAIIQYNSLTFEHLVEEIWRVFQNCYFVGEKVIYHEEGSSCLCEVVAARKEHASEFIEEFSIKLETEEIKQHKYDVVRCSDQKFYRNINGTQLNRQKNPLTKNIIRQFIREVAYKDRYVGAPWIVSSKLVDKYDLLKEVPAKYLVAMNKNMKKVQLQREREREKLENRNNEKYKQHKEKVVYPIEDSELPVDPRLNKFPIPSFCMTDFSPEQFSTLLFTWHFLWYFQKPLKLLSFHVEDYEDALLAEGFSPLLLNIYCSLLSILLLKHSIQQALNEHNWDNTIKVYLKARAQETFYETDVPKELKKLEDFKSLSSSQRLLLIKMFIDDAVCSEPIRGFIQSAMDTCCEATKERRVERASYRKSCAERERMRKASLADARNTASTSEESNDEDFKDTKNFTDSLLATTNKAPRRAVLQYKKMLEVEELRIQQALEGKKREETLKKAKRRREEEDFKKSLEEEKEDQEREYKYRELLLKLGGYRCKPLGADRRRSLYYLFDSRIYVEDVEGKWGYYALPSELEQLLGYLNTKGKRELKFHQTLMENFSVLQTCIKERQEEFEGDNQIRHSARIQKKYLKETSK